MSMKVLSLAFALAACGFSGVAAAKSESQQWKFTADTPAAFEEQAAKVRDGMAANGQYSGVGQADRHTVETELNKIRELLYRKGEAGSLNDRDQVDLANAQERVNAILTRNDGDRLVCTYERRSGSNFKYKSCMTVSQRDAERRRSQEGFQNSFMKGGATQQSGN